MKLVPGQSRVLVMANDLDPDEVFGVWEEVVSGANYEDKDHNTITSKMGIKSLLGMVCLTFSLLHSSHESTDSLTFFPGS